MIVAEQLASHGQRLIVKGRGFVVVSLCEVVLVKGSRAAGLERLVNRLVETLGSPETGSPETGSPETGSSETGETEQFIAGAGGRLESG